MATLPILTYPNPLLKMQSVEVPALDQAREKFIADLVETLESSPGCVGIAAPQVGVLERIIAIDLRRSSRPYPNQGRMILINPRIEWQEGEVLGREGCLSLPHLTANVKRARRIGVSARRPDWSEIYIQCSDFEARVVLHEYDHLDGLLFLDRVASLKTDVFRRKNYGPPPPG